MLGAENAGLDKASEHPPGEIPIAETQSLDPPCARVFLEFGSDLLQNLVKKIIAGRVRIDDKQRRQIGVDAAEKGKLHEHAARDRNAGDAGACGPHRAGIIMKHEYDDLVGQCQVLHDFAPFSRVKPDEVAAIG